MSRSIALLLLILAGVACLAPALSASEDENPIFIAPDESVPVSVQGSQKAASEKKAQTPAETSTAAEKKTEEEATPVAAEQKAPAPAPVETAAAEKEIPLPPVPENEQKLHDMVKQSVRASLKGHTPKLLSAQLAALKAIEKNLSIQIQGKQEDILRLVIQEAKALFDPVFTVSGSQSMHTQYSRFERPKIFEQKTKTMNVYDPVTGNLVGTQQVTDLAPGATPQVPLRFLVWSAPRPNAFKDWGNPNEAAAPASETILNGPLQTNNGNLQISQQLPWGPAVFIALASQKQAQFYDDGANPGLQQEIQAINQQIEGYNAIIAEPTTTDADRKAAEISLTAAQLKQKHLEALFTVSVNPNKGTNYDKPWSSSASVSALIPVPYMKDWGKYSFADKTLRQAELGRDRAFWDTKNVINLTLVNVDHAYWDLAGRLENLRATSENRKLLEGLQKKIQELLDAGRILPYGKFQIDSQLASVKQQEEQAWTAFTQASNALINLLDIEDNTVLLPAGYSSVLSEPTKLSTSEAYTVAMENRPDLKAQRIGGKTSEVQLKFAKNQVKPDLKWTPSISFSQNAAPFGFGSFEQSWAALFGFGSTKHHLTNVPLSKFSGNPVKSAFDLKAASVAEQVSGPDRRVISHTLSYNWPFLNHTLKAQLVQAEAQRDMQDITIQSTEKQVEEDVGDAVVGILSAKTQYDLANEQYKLADTQYNQAAELLGLGRMTEFEIISRSADLLTADLSRVAAAIAYKKAEANLLYAEGVLPNTYAGMRSNSQLEGSRLEALAATSALHFFKPMPLPISDSSSEAAAPKTEAKEQANGN